MLIPFKCKIDDDIKEFIKVMSAGYLSERISCFKNFLLRYQNDINNLEIPEKWNSRLLRRCFQSITSIVINDKSPSAVLEAIEIINQLRSEQKQFEHNFLSQMQENERPYAAAEILSLYHFARVVECVGGNMLWG